MCSWDEDAVTLAVEAARDCLGSGSLGEVTSVVLASTTAPFADLQNSVILARALDLATTIPCTDLSGSTRSGLSALATALEGVAGHRLVVASDRRYAKPGSAQEMTYGSGAAGLLVGQGNLLARYLGREVASVPFVDHFRQSGQKYDYYWEERWIRDEGVSRLVPATINRLLKRLNLSADRIAWLGLSGVPRGSDRLLAKALSVPPERLIPDLHDAVGDIGSAQAPLQLVNALERSKPGDLIVVAAFGQGCEVLAFERGESSHKPARGLQGALAERIEETSYLKALSFDGELRLDWGPRSENEIKAALTQQYRSADQVLGFVGGKCEQCGQAQFPRLPQCVNCGAQDSQRPYRLAEELAQIATFSADWLQFYPAPPLYVGLVQFDGGARLLMEMIDVGAPGLKVGTRLRMNFRVKGLDSIRHYGRYFWKASPTD
jgi:3-hydroxy-3-methylglutaryl CoA synthase